MRSMIARNKGDNIERNIIESMISSILFVIRSHALIARADVSTTGVHPTKLSDRVIWYTYWGIRG